METNNSLKISHQSPTKVMKRILQNEANLPDTFLPLLEKLNKIGFSTFIHGSAVFGEATKKSDIDIAFIGDFLSIPKSIISENIPAGTDYVSCSFRVEGKRRISLHFVNPEFRTTQPNINNPYALEYRPPQHIKDKSPHYILSLFTKDGEVILARFKCDPLILKDGGTLTKIPQSGLWKITKHPHLNVFTANTLDGTSIPVDILSDKILKQAPHHKAVTLFALGLEFDKLSYEQPVFQGCVDQHQAYTIKPITTTCNSLKDFLSGEPAKNICYLTDMAFLALANSWNKRQEI